MDRVTVGQLCEPGTGQIKLDSEALIDYFDIASVNSTSKSITGFTTYTFGEAPSRARKAIKKNSILVSTVRPNLNAVALFDKETPNTPVASTGFCVLDCKEGTNPRFLFNYLQSKSFIDEMVAQATGASYPAVSDKIVKSAYIPAYSYEKQTAIANVLDGLAEIISKRKQQLQKLDELVKARFIELFGGADYPNVLFENVCVFLRNGASIKQTKGAGGYPITRIETLSNDVFNTDRLGYADITDLEKYQSYVLHHGDILISHINSVAYLGRAVQYRGQLDTPIIHGLNLLCARIADSYKPTYIEWFFKTPMAKEYISTITKKAVNQASITTSDLKKMQVPNPPKGLQDQFATFVEQIDKSKVVVKKALDEAQTLFESLMQEYFG